MLNIIIFGPPGAGKGTQATQLSDKYELVHLSTGDILRSEIAAESELGLKAKHLMDKGNLVPDEVVMGMISSNLDSNREANGFIFDGFPRTISQANSLDELLEEKKTSITMVLALAVNEKELIKRLLNRGKDSGRSDDQDEQIIHNRITEYINKTAPLIEFYTNQGKFNSVEGIGSVEEIFERLCISVYNLDDLRVEKS